MNTLPNEYGHRHDNSKRIESNSKKKTINRIHMYKYIIVKIL